MDLSVELKKKTAPPNPEVVAKPRRRTFPADYKQRVLEEAAAAQSSGTIGAPLRREGLYSSHLVMWRRERAAGIVEALTPQRRGPKSKCHPLVEENQQLRHRNERLAALTARSARRLRSKRPSSSCSSPASRPAPCPTPDTQPW